MQLEAASLDELAQALSRIEGLEQWLGTSAVAINDVMTTDKNTPLHDGDRVAILPPVCGG